MSDFVKVYMYFLQYILLRYFFISVTEFSIKINHIVPILTNGLIYSCLRVKRMSRQHVLSPFT